MSAVDLSGVKVGDKLILCGVNMQNRTQEVEVVKVGRTLVYIQEFGRPIAYRKDTGSRNDQYGHTWLRTPEWVREDKARSQALQRLRHLGMGPAGYGTLSYSAETLTKVCDLLESQ